MVGGSDLVAILREEILAVIAKHMTLDPDNVRVKMDRNSPSPRSRSRSTSRLPMAPAA